MKPFNSAVRGSERNNEVLFHFQTVKFRAVAVLFRLHIFFAPPGHPLYSSRMYERDFARYFEVRYYEVPLKLFL